ncbi:MAG: DDE-type integrase/transposase/recombinase [Eubacteriaceae bacterium]|nr:DDE-type integrase/transposase/recombinase [Eubacteriaceae bacterium]
MPKRLQARCNLDAGWDAARAHMREMGIEAIYPRRKPDLSQPGSKVFPCLLGSLETTRPNQAWAIGMTYIPIRTSFLYMAAIIGLYSRYVLSWKLGGALGIGFALDACSGARKLGAPTIMNSDQGSQFTSPEYFEPFLEAGSRISMGHRGRANGNIFIERLWRRVKYENVYLQDYQPPREAIRGLRGHMLY